ncbi:ribonuclease H-like protein [Rhizophagus irregularis]|uniref:DNA polymerase n=1 Tax=Rhizophagus irregularis TaxID=588596 RepID=A0A2I1GMI8_9GLOM|nr:ribonuclease H-like protein [Rhizophagus irregularis]
MSTSDFEFSETARPDDCASGEGKVIRYSGKENLTGIPTRNEIISENDEGLTAILNNALAERQEIPFMATDFEGSTEKINGKYHYVLRLYGSLINGQKAVVTVEGIQVFFDALIPEKETADSFKIKVNDVLSSVIKDYKIEHIKAFPLRGYHTEKKSYLRIITRGTGDRKKALQAIQKNNFKTASDDMWFRQATLRTPSVSVNNFQPVDNLKILSDRFPISALTRDRTLILTWDIETYDLRGTGDFPEILDESGSVFMICMSLHWKDDPKPLKQVCLVDLETAPDSRWVTVVCGNQVNLLKAFALCWRAFQPDIQLGFNDTDYDWPFIIERAYKYEILIGVNSKNTFRHENPTNGGDEDEKPTNGGDEDEKPTNGGDEKEDERSGQPIEIKIALGNFFKSTFLKIPGCVPVDVRPCFKKLNTRSEKSSLKYYLKICKLESKAEMPVNKMWRIYAEVKENPSELTARNMHEIANYCIIDALRCQELMVKRNVINDYREVASLAYISLFDAHYRANGMKHNAMRKCREGQISRRLRISAKKRHRVEKTSDGTRFCLVIPSLIMAYNLSPEKIITSEAEADIMQKNGCELHKIEFPFNNRVVRAWSVRHSNKVEKKGLFPVVLEELFNKRAELKTQLASLGKRKERLGEKITVRPEGIYEYFLWRGGNAKSPIFLLALAGGITSAGQYNLNLVAKYVTGKGFRIKYGDTDSLYLTCPDKYYEKCDDAFARGGLPKEDYWTEMVKITMDVMKKLRDQVNAYLALKNGTTYLKMAYEEVLFPVCFTGKKKYFGVPHEGIVNFRPDAIFTKGIDTWDFVEFEMTAAWKPKVKNQCIQRFIARMREKGLKIPDPGERFSFVVVKKPPLYSKKGKEKQVNVGERMEYSDNAKKDKMEIDINYYIDKTRGLCARFINNDERYQPPPTHKIMQIRDADEREKRIDSHSQSEAKKWLEKYIKSL